MHERRRVFLLALQRLALALLIALALPEFALAGGGPVRKVILAVLEEFGLTEGGVRVVDGLDATLAQGAVSARPVTLSGANLFSANNVAQTFLGTSALTVTDGEVGVDGDVFITRGGPGLWHLNSTSGGGGDGDALARKITVTDELAACEIDGEAQVDLTDGAAVAIFTISLADLETGGGEISYSAHCGDGTDSQAYSSKMQWTAVADGVTILADVTSPITFDSTIVTPGGGTLAPQGGATNGWTFTNNGDGTGTYNMQMNTSLASTTFFHLRFLIIEHSDGSISIP